MGYRGEERERERERERAKIVLFISPIARSLSASFAKGKDGIKTS